MGICYVDGEYVDEENAVIPVTDMAVLRGYAVFDFFRTYGGRPFHLSDHIQRLRRSAELIGLQFPWSESEITQIIFETLISKIYKILGEKLNTCGMIDRGVGQIMRKNNIIILVVVGILSFTVVGSVLAGEPQLSNGQLVYVPAYSNIYISNRSQRFELTVTLVIRNVDTQHPITLQSVDYYDTNGKLIRKYLNQARGINAFETMYYIVQQKDDAGGVGAKFLVKWKSDTPVNVPIIESVMIGAEGQQGISFSSRGTPITKNK